MDKTSISLHVFFEPPFWIAIWNRISNDQMEVCKVTFGAEPKDTELHLFLLNTYSKLRFSPSVAAAAITDHKNPKRRQRETRELFRTPELGTRSQQALKLLQEEKKLQRRMKSKQQREEESDRKFAARQQKRREKHRGH